MVGYIQVLMILIGINWNNVNSHQKQKFRKTLHIIMFFKQSENVVMHYFSALWGRTYSFQTVNSRLNPLVLLVVRRMTKSLPKLTEKKNPLNVLFGDSVFVAGKIGNYFLCTSEYIFWAKKSGNNVTQTTAEELWHHKQPPRSLLVLTGRAKLLVCCRLFVSIFTHCFGILCSSRAARWATHRALHSF